MNNRDRNRLIHDEVVLGLVAGTKRNAVYRLLAERFGISKQRVDQIYEAEERKRAAGSTWSPGDLSTPIDALGLSVRTYNCFRKDGIGTLGEILDCSAASLLRMPDFGRKSLAELEAKLAERGLSLSTTTRAFQPASPGGIAEQLHDIIAADGVINPRRIVWWCMELGVVRPGSAENDDTDEVEEVA